MLRRGNDTEHSSTCKAVRLHVLNTFLCVRRISAGHCSTMNIDWSSRREAPRVVLTERPAQEADSQASSATQAGNSAGSSSRPLPSAALFGSAAAAAASGATSSNATTADVAVAAGAAVSAGPQQSRGSTAGAVNSTGSTPSPARTFVRAAVQTPIRYMNQVTRLSDICHFSVIGESPNDDHETLAGPPLGGSWMLLAPEQSNKTADIVAVAVDCASQRRPHIVLVADSKDNVGATQAKMNQILQQLPGHLRVMFCSGDQKMWDAHNRSAETVAAIKAGTCTLLLPAYDAAMSKLVAFLRQHSISGAHLTLDEGDAMLSYALDPRTAFGQKKLTKRERLLFELLGTPPLTGPARLCTSVLWVSATHLATFWWHLYWRLPFRALIADKAATQARGYAVEDDFELAVELNSRKITKKNHYGIYTAEVRAMFDEFNADNRPARLMAVTLTPWVRANGRLTLDDLARIILDVYVPNAAVVIICGDEDSTTTVPVLYRERMGKVQERELRVSPGDSKAHVGISFVDARWGLDKAVVVVGYHLTKRCVSIRSDERVITHMISHFQGGKNRADTRQMLMRAAGHTKELRARHNNGQPCKVRVACTKADFDMAQALYEFTALLLRNAADGTQQGLVAALTKPYPAKYQDAIGGARPFVRSTMDDAEFKKVLQSLRFV